MELHRDIITTRTRRYSVRSADSTASGLCAVQRHKTRVSLYLPTSVAHHDEGSLITVSASCRGVQAAALHRPRLDVIGQRVRRPILAGFLPRTHSKRSSSNVRQPNLPLYRGFVSASVCDLISNSTCSHGLRFNCRKEQGKHAARFSYTASTTFSSNTQRLGSPLIFIGTTSTVPYLLLPPTCSLPPLLSSERPNIDDSHQGSSHQHARVVQDFRRLSSV